MTEPVEREHGNWLPVTLPPDLTREDIEALLERAGFAEKEPTQPRPTVMDLAAFVSLLDGRSASDPGAAASKLLDELEAADRAFTIWLRAEKTQRQIPAEELRSADGPYRRLAEVVADFLVGWLSTMPFGEHSLLTGLVVAEHLLALHGFVVELAYGQPLKGAVCQFAWRLAHPEQGKPANRQQLVNAILGRFRGQAG